jgi:hypothetical protein
MPHCNKSQPQNHNIKINNSEFCIYDENKEFKCINKTKFFNNLRHMQSPHGKIIR